MEQAQGRILREDIQADRDFPPYNRVMMDGYALQFSEFAGGRRRFSVVSVEPAGKPAASLHASEACIEVSTGAVLPLGTDCVAPYELTERAGDQVSVLADTQQLRSGNAVHPRGEDFKKGDTLVKAGTLLGGRELAVAAACGRSQLQVSKQPRITILATGDELSDPNSESSDWQVRRSNDIALASALGAAGFRNVDRQTTHDSEDEIEAVLGAALARGDWILSSGGVSKGKFDHLPTVFRKLGVRCLAHGVAQRPGKPFYFGVGETGTPVFALPGNPASAFICCHRYVLPALLLASQAPYLRPLQVEIAGTQPLRTLVTQFLPVKLGRDSARRIAQIVELHNSGDFARLVETDGFVEVGPESEMIATTSHLDFWPWA